MPLEPQYFGSGGGLLPASEASAPVIPLGGNRVETVSPTHAPAGAIGGAQTGPKAGDNNVQGPTVAALITANLTSRGVRAYVVDSTEPFAANNVGFAVKGGGKHTVPVFCNGSIWVIG